MGWAWLVLGIIRRPEWSGGSKGKERGKWDQNSKGWGGLKLHRTLEAVIITGISSEMRSHWKVLKRGVI